METCRSCGANLAPDAEWCGRCYAVVRVVGPLSRQRDPSQHVVRVPDVETRPTLGAGPTSLGIFGRLAITAALVLIGLGLYVGLAAWVEAGGRAAFGLLMAVLGAYSVLALVALWFTWRPGERRVVRVEGEVTAIRPPKRDARAQGAGARR